MAVVECRVLGPVEIRVDDVVLPLGGSKVRVVLAGLLLHAGEVVVPNQLGRWLWDGDEPARPRAAIQTYIARTRSALGTVVPIITEHGGYRAEIYGESLDLSVFRGLRTAAGRAVAEHDVARAATLYGKALSLWHGPPLANVESSSLHREENPVLEQLHRQTQLDWAATTIEAGRPAAAIPLLTSLVEQDPLQERLAELLMRALHRSGRRVEALETYRRTAAAMADQLGLDPGQALAELHLSLLNDQRPAPHRPERETADPVRPVPHQLPAPAPHFAGRAAELDAFDGVMKSGLPPRTVTVDGIGGAGKTAFALECAHRFAPLFPDGHYFVDLRGFGPGPQVDPATALEDLLWASGVRGQELPPGLDARQTLWRERTSGHKILLVLDNARSAAQVRPLLPGQGGLTLVTSRRRLGSLGVHEGAHRIALGSLSAADALTVLADSAGRTAFDDAPQAAAELVGACAGLPLALRILGQRIRRQPTSLPEVVSELRREHGRLAALVLDDEDDTDLRAVFGRSLDFLSPEAACLFRRLGLHPGSFLDVDVAAVLVGFDRPRTEELLRELATANLLEQRGSGRWAFHDLLREFAAAECGRAEPAETRVRLLDRLLDWYTVAAFNASKTARPYRRYDILTLPGDLPDAPAFGSHSAATAWLSTHEVNVAAAVRWASSHGRPVAAWQLPYLMMVGFIASSRFDVWQETFEIGLAAARTLGNRRAESAMLSGFGTMHGLAGSHGSALDAIRAAQEISRELDDAEGELHALFNLGLQYNTAGLPDEAYAHLAQAVDLARRLGFASLEADSLEQLSDSCARTGDYPTALRLAEAALAIWDRLGRHNQRLYALQSRGRARIALGDHAGGIADCVAAAEQFERNGEHVDEAFASDGLGDVHEALGDLDSAIAAWQRAHTVFVRLDHPAAATVAGKLAAHGRSPVP
ncbi:tetratricopeptide repeat protein [Amycolatopsis sp. OK19-0408]|uniref:Tetratricopeptide repeat protein n=1 Tax=Amycolatopsis iheyensis TaxID=2945988 RepID=A0A9X2NGK6_9PSEU|nr:BTAD domain-containing putative transcriptional regulator [Amycolatopsis iheyensis]MCR6488416.1 tetratricopeptide repeat protein [Amycolatopsis iheyensis]